MTEAEFVHQYMANCADYARAARWHGTKRTQAGKDRARTFLARMLYKRISAAMSTPPPPPAPSAPANPNNKQTSPTAGGGQHTNYASTSSIAQEARLVCGCKACRAGKGHS